MLARTDRIVNMYLQKKKYAWEQLSEERNLESSMLAGEIT